MFLQYMVECSIMAQNSTWRICGNFRRASNFCQCARHKGAKWFKNFNFITNWEFSTVKRNISTRHPSLVSRVHA